MTPAEFIAANPTACKDGRDCIMQFQTMRDWWLSPDCRVAWMLWALGRDEKNKAGIVAFAKSGADEAKRVAAAAARGPDASRAVFAARCAADAADAAARGPDASRAVFAARCAADAAASAASAAAASAAAVAASVSSIQSQRDKLRDIFPDMFVTKKETP